MRREPFNLIITHYPGYDNFVVVREQLYSLLEDIRIIDSSQSIILALVEDPYKTIEVIKEAGLTETPILRVIPVDRVTDVYVDRIASVVKEVLYAKSKENESFMIRIDGRIYLRKDAEIEKIHRSDAINIIADGIDRPVNLTSPDWLVYIKTIKMYRVTELAAITVCKPDQIISFASRENI